MILKLRAQAPYVFFLLPFIAGIATCLWLTVPGPAIVWYAFLIICIAAFFLFNIFYKRLGIFRHQWLGSLIAIFALYTAGYLLTLKTDVRKQKDYYTRYPATHLLVTIDNDPVKSGNYIRFTTIVKQAFSTSSSYSTTGKLLIVIPVNKKADRLAYGDRLLIPAVYALVAPPYNPAEFNYQRYLANQNVYNQAFLNAGKYIRLDCTNGNPFIAFAYRLRRLMVERLTTGLQSPEVSGVAATLLLGYKAELNPDLLQAYSSTGTLHILSVSGAHVAIIYALINLCLGFLQRYKHGRWLNALLVIIFIWAYAMLTGFSPSVCRAVIMLSCVVTARALYRYANAVNLLAASALLLLLYNPLLLTDVGFQLSYCAVFGLFVIQPILQQSIKIKNRYFAKLWYLCSVSLAAQLTTLPLMLLYFHQFPVYFLISNLFIILPAELIISTGAIYLLSYPIHFIAKYPAFILKYSVTFTNRVLVDIEHLPFSTINRIWITGVEALLLVILLAGLMAWLRKRESGWLFTMLGCFLLLCISAGFKTYQATETQRITFLNLKKQAGILFQANGAGLMLTELRPDDKAFKRSVQPLLDSSRLQRYNLLQLNQNYNSPALIKQEGYINFMNTSIIVLDSAYTVLHSKQPLHVDYVYVTGRSKINLDNLNRYYTYNMLIAGDLNTDEAIARLKADAAAQHAKFISLKRNKAFVVASK